MGGDGDLHSVAPIVVPRLPDGNLLTLFPFGVVDGRVRCYLFVVGVVVDLFQVNVLVTLFPSCCCW